MIKILKREKREKDTEARINKRFEISSSSAVAWMRSVKEI